MGIEERASQYARNSEEWAAYWKGAKDQLNIDIEKFVRYAENFNKEGKMFGYDARIDVESMRQWVTRILVADDIMNDIFSDVLSSTLKTK